MQQDTILFFQTLSAPQSREKVAGAFRYLESSGWNVRLIEQDATPAEIKKTLKKLNPLGCIIDRGLANGRNPVRLMGKIPTIYFDQSPDTAVPGCWYVRHDSEATTQMAFRELSRNAPAHFAFVKTQKRTFWCEEREAVFRKLVKRQKKKLTVLSPDLELADNLAGLPKPCGILAVTDAIARKVVDAARQANVTLPNDLQIVGINNDEFICGHTNPTLTSVHPDFEGGGYLAMATLHRIIHGTSAKPRTILFGPKTLVRRASTRIFRKSDIRVTRALDFISEHFANTDLKTETIATAMGCSRSLADLRFREVTGHTIRDEIRLARINEAKRLLADRSRELSAIPSLCGYLSAPTFARIFKEATSMTMREFRHAQKIDTGSLRQCRR